jgi:hypothetical protein
MATAVKDKTQAVLNLTKAGQQQLERTMLGIDARPDQGALPPGGPQQPQPGPQGPQPGPGGPPPPNLMQ